MLQTKNNITLEGERLRAPEIFTVLGFLLKGNAKFWEILKIGWIVIL